MGCCREATLESFDLAPRHNAAAMGSHGRLTWSSCAESKGKVLKGRNQPEVLET